MSIRMHISPWGFLKSYECLLGLMMLCTFPLMCTQTVCDEGQANENAVCDCDDLRVLCNGNGLVNVPDHGFPGNATFIDLGHNKINTIRTNDFITAKKLQFLYLHSNEISTIAANAFRELTSLIYLDLLNNHISRLDSQTFKGLFSLEALYLEHNIISTIEANAFRDLTSLTRLYLEYNNISTIEANVFRGLTSLTILVLSYNNISTIQANAFRNLTSLTHLVMSHNRISHLDSQTFQGLLSLEAMYLDNNNIPTIQANAFRDLTSLAYLGLSHNHISHLDSQTFQGLLSLKQMIPNTTLEFQCDCETKYLRDWAETKSVELPSITCENFGYAELKNITKIAFGQCPGFCQQEVTSSVKGEFHWEITLVENEATVECPFPSSIRSIGKRACVMSESSNPIWGDPDLADCSVPSNISRDLLNLANENITNDSVAKFADQLESLTKNQMIATDVYYTSLALENLLQTPNVTMNLTSVVNVLGTYSNLMRQDDEILKESQQGFGSINRSLAILDNLSGKIDTIPPNGTITLPQVALGVLPANSSTGGAVFRIKKSENDRFDPQRVTLMSNNTAFKPNDTAVAIEIPASILNSTNKLVQFVAFTDDTLFEAMENNTEGETALHPQRKINSQIVSASIDNEHMENLTDPIRITFNHKIQRAQSPECVYWDFESSSWSSHGCHTLENETNEYTVCQCDHLTYFALLMDIFGEGDDVSAEDELALTLISHVGCSISLASLLLTLMAYSFFSKLRKDDKAKLLMNLCSALTMVMMFFILVTQPSIRGNTIACQVTAGLLHYFVMATWTWMAVGAFHMYFTVIKVFNTYIKRFLLKCCLIGWGVPAIIVIITVAISTDDYGVQGDDNICWLAGNAFYGGCVAPILFILVGNFVVFGLVIHQIRKLSERREEHGAKVTMIKTQLRGAFTLVVLLGLTWVFAIFAFWKGGIVFIYLFTIFNSLQGLFIFIFYFALKREVRDILQKKIKSLSSSGGTATTGLSNTQSPLTPSAPELDQAVTTTDAGLSDAQSPSTSSAPGHHQAVTTTDAGLSDAQSPSTSSAPKRHHAVITTDSGLSDNQSP